MATISRSPAAPEMLTDDADPDAPLSTDPPDLALSITAAGELVADMIPFGITFVAIPVSDGQNGLYSIARW